MKILIVEDDLALTRVLKHALDKQGHQVESVSDGEAAMKRVVPEHECDLLLLDLTLPRRDGFEVLQKARAWHSNMRILVLSGRSRIEERVRALDEGADDFLAKPFSLMELNARVRALLRRTGPAHETATIQVADLVIDRLCRSVRRGERQIELTSKEFALLTMLASNNGRPVSRSTILREVWKMSDCRPSNIIDVYVNYIRKPFTPEQVKEHVMPLLGGGA